MAILFSVGCIEIPGSPYNDEAAGEQHLPDPGPTLQPHTDKGSLDDNELGPDERTPEDPDILPVELPDTCENHCECPSGYDCINTRCVLGEMPIYCCSHPECPAGQHCWAKNGAANTCPEPSD